MFEPEEHVKGRCEGCEYRKRVYAQGNYSFYGCYHRPYSGKRVAEIKDCPKEENKDIDKMIEDLLEMDIAKADNTVIFSPEAKRLIHEIAEKCKNIPIVEETTEQAEEYAKGLSAEQVYTDMLCKIVNAPTSIHMRMSARMLVPIIDQKLKSESRKTESEG